MMSPYSRPRRRMKPSVSRRRWGSTPRSGRPRGPGGVAGSRVIMPIFAMGMPPRAGDQPDTVLRAQRHERLEGDGMPRDEAQPEALKDHRHGHHHLHHREVVADADARAAAEGEEG